MGRLEGNTSSSTGEGCTDTSPFASALPFRGCRDTPASALKQLVGSLRARPPSCGR